MVVDEDAGDPTVLFAWDALPINVLPEYDTEDALDHAVAPEVLWPDFWCDFCDTRNESSRWTCCMCGTVRHDADELA